MPTCDEEAEPHLRHVGGEDEGKRERGKGHKHELGHEPDSGTYGYNIVSGNFSRVLNVRYMTWAPISALPSQAVDGLEDLDTHSP